MPSIFTHPVLIMLRSVGRRFGVNRLLALLRLQLTPGYEDAFGSALMREIRTGDIVWDVGANVGFYTTKFSAKTGSTGVVVAFEPVPQCYRQLRELAGGFTNIAPYELAIGAEDGRGRVLVAPGILPTTSQIGEGVLTETADDEGSHSVTVRAATSFVEEHNELFPNVIKVDVEGFECAVFSGMRGILGDERLRCLAFEIHFGALEQRRELDGVRLMELELRALGFRVQWHDPSHFIAIRVRDVQP